MISRLILLVICLLLAAGCSWFSDEDVRRYQRQKPLAKVIDELPDLRLPVSDERKPTREEVVRAYERVYGQIIDRIENQAVGKRLADLEMFAAEEKDAAGSGEPYDQALAMYQQLVRDPEHVGQAKILYQIARVYDLKGDTPTARSYLDQLIERFPDSEYESEARFRRAEMAFSAEDYRSARDDYEAVVDKGPDTQFWMNAHYMMGWAQFKLGELEGGLSNFFTVVDVLLEKGAQPLTTTETELLNDSFRVTTLALAYLDGPATLAGEMRSLEHPHWQYLAYEKLAQDYLDKERYLDNVTTWQMFIDENPLDARAPDAHIGMIKTLIDADFPSQVQPKKEAFIRGYGIRSEFWQVHDADSRAHYVDTLKTYLQETATLNHALAQAIVVVDESDARIKAFLDSAAWYSELIETFPADPQVPDHVFLLGEAYTEAFDDEQAILAYRRLVREFPGHTNADEAGYAMVLGFTRLLDSRPDDMILFDRKIDAQLEFTSVFMNDPRAATVQTDAASSLFAHDRFSEAVVLAEEIPQIWTDAEPSLVASSLKITGHSRFELGQFHQAESAYKTLLDTGVLTDSSEVDSINERLMASIYKQAEATEALGEVDAAIGHFLRIAEVNAGSTLAQQGLFDAVAVLESQDRLAAAALLLDRFRDSYPDHLLGNDAPIRLASMYERSEQWPLAAQELLIIAETDVQPELKAQSLYRAAEIYLQLDDVDLALEHFRTYAHTYPAPAEVALEAMNHMDLLYQRVDDQEKRRFWLNRKIALHKEMGRGATQRATYLAAEAQFVFAEDERNAFEAIALTNPLKKSLKTKQTALKRTLSAYEKATDYKVETFSTASTYRIANLYSNLASAVMASERPQKLSALEMEQYEILLEEQAFPFEEQAIELHEINMRRSWEGVYDEWVQLSFTALRHLMPARFDKDETEVAYVRSIH